MSATRENVLSAISQYVESNKRRAPAKEIATLVGDTLPNVQAIIKDLISSGAVNSSRGRNGGILPDGVQLEKKVVAPKKAAPIAASVEHDAPQSDEALADQFAALMEKLESEDSQAAAV